MGVHFGLLSDAGGVDFLLRADCRDFYEDLVRCELEGIFNVGLIFRFGGRSDNQACGTIFDEGGVEDDIGGEFVNGESGEDVVDRVVVTASLIEVVKEGL